MGTETNKQLVRRYLEEVVNTGNVQALARFVSPESVEVDHGVSHPAGLEGAKAHILEPSLAIGAIRVVGPVEQPDASP